MALEVRDWKTLVEVAREARWLMETRGLERRTAAYVARFQVYSMIYPRGYWS